jgi:excisionase family DNA binding protein
MSHVLDIMTPQEVATALKVTRRTVYRLIASRQLPAVRVGGQYRLPVSAVEDALTPANSD